MDYQFENGRRYHAYEQGKYHLPNDEVEASRLDLQHQICMLMHRGKLYSAPLEDNITNALDIGTGTGVWAVEFGDRHPNCNVVGTDLSPIQPTWVPPNVSFLIDDCDSDREWIFPPQDFIHCRFITAGLKNWNRYIQRSYAALKPGGWIEMLEPRLPNRCDDGTASEDHPMIKWTLHVGEAAAKHGVDIGSSDRFLDQLADAGFVNIVREDHRWPIGPWTGDEREDLMGRYMVPNMEEGVNTSVAFFTRVLGWSQEEFQVFSAQCRASMKDLSKHVYMPITVHYAQKPLEPGPSVDGIQASPLANPDVPEPTSVPADGVVPSHQDSMAIDEPIDDIPSHTTQPAAAAQLTPEPQPVTSSFVGNQTDQSPKAAIQETSSALPTTATTIIDLIPQTEEIAAQENQAKSVVSGKEFYPSITPPPAPLLINTTTGDLSAAESSPQTTTPTTITSMSTFTTATTAVESHGHLPDVSGQSLENKAGGEEEVL